MKNHRILVVDDEPASRTGLQELLTLWEYEVAAAADGQEALDLAGASTPDLVIADLVMPGIDGLELLSRLRRDAPTTAVVFLTGQGSIETAVQAIKDGAYDYLTKPVDPTRLQLLLDRALERSEAARELRLLRRQLRQRGAFGRLLGGSHDMMEVMRQVEAAAPTDATIFISGRAAPARSWSPAHSTSSHPAGKAPSSPSTARRSRRRCWRARFSGTSVDRSPVPWSAVKDVSSSPTAGRCFWTKSRRCRDPGQVPPRTSGRAVPTAGRQGRDPCERPGRRGDEQGADQGATGRHPARRPLLSTPCLRDRVAAISGSAGGPSRTRAGVHRGVQRALRP